MCVLVACMHMPLCVHAVHVCDTVCMSVCTYVIVCNECRPTIGSNPVVNFFRFCRTLPRVTSGWSALRSTLRMAWVAQAFLITWGWVGRALEHYQGLLFRRNIVSKHNSHKRETSAQCYACTHTCLAKNIVSSLLSCTTEPAGSSPARHLKRKMSP